MRPDSWGPNLLAEGAILMLTAAGPASAFRRAQKPERLGVMLCAVLVESVGAELQAIGLFLDRRFIARGCALFASASLTSVCSFAQVDRRASSALAGATLKATLAHKAAAEIVTGTRRMFDSFGRDTGSRAGTAADREWT